MNLSTTVRVALGLLLGICSGCTSSEIVRPVPWMKIETKSRSGSGLTFNPGPLPGYGSSEDRWSYAYVRTSPSSWTRLPITPRPDVYVLPGGHSIVAGWAGAYELYVEGAPDAKALPEGGDLRIRAGDGRIVWSDCRVLVQDEACGRIEVKEIDVGGVAVGSYAIDVPSTEYWTIDGLTAGGLLVHTGVKACAHAPDGTPRDRENDRCRVSEVVRDGVRDLASADRCTPAWLASQIAAHRAPEVPPWNPPAKKP